MCQVECCVQYVLFYCTRMFTNLKHSVLPHARHPDGWRISGLHFVALQDTPSSKGEKCVYENDRMQNIHKTLPCLDFVFNKCKKKTVITDIVSSKKFIIMCQEQIAILRTLVSFCDSLLN